MEGYLLDTCVISSLLDRTKPRHAAVRLCLDRLSGDAPVFVSAIVLGEIEYGINAEPKMLEQRKQELRGVRALFPTVDVRETTKIFYGSIRAALFEGKIKHGKRALRPEQLVDPVTSLRLAVQENDIWITALALEHRLTLVTHDMKMRPLWEAAGEELNVRDWADPDFAWPCT